MRRMTIGTKPMPEGFEQPHVVHDEPCPSGDLRIDGARGTRIESPFNQGFIDDLKDRWHHGERFWSPDEEVWWVIEGHEEEVEEMVVEHYGGARIVDADGTEMLRDKSGDYSQGGLW